MSKCPNNDTCPAFIGKLHSGCLCKQGEICMQVRSCEHCPNKAECDKLISERSLSRTTNEIKKGVYTNGNKIGLYHAYSLDTMLETISDNKRNIKSFIITFDGNIYTTIINFN